MIINGDNLSKSLCVSKVLINTLNIKYLEVLEHLKQNTKDVEECDNTEKTLKIVKSEVPRLTNKANDAQNTIAKLRETKRHSLPQKEYNALLCFAEKVSPRNGSKQCQ